MPVFVFVPVFISLYNLSTGLFNLLITGVLRQFSEVMHDKMSKIKTTVRFCLTIFHFLNFKFNIHSNSIPILKLYTDTFKKMVCLR